MTGAPTGGSADPVRYVCMPGSPYTGSTLLGFLLNDHPSCASIGAATGLTAKVDLPTYVCSCGTRFLDCPFWNRIAARTIELGRPVTVFRKDFWNTHVRLSRRRSVNGVLVSSLGNPSLTAARDRTIGRLGPIRQRVSHAREASWSLATAVLEATGARVFVDTARDHQRPKHLMGSPLLDLKVIHLVRDPRGNVASIMKHTGVDAATAARQWRHYNLEADRVRRDMPSGSWMLLHYEELCADPQGTLDRIARFVGVAPAPSLQRGAPAEHHIIGNSMRLRGVEEIREDRAWETTLDAGDLRQIADITLPVSRRLGFDWPASRPHLVRSA
ncbi:MAG: sulfotransferase [Actinomycetota bacterium]